MLGLRALPTCGSLYLYLTWCWWWNGLGKGAAFFAPASCLFLWLAMKRILDLRWATALVVGLGAGLTCLALSSVLLDPALGGPGQHGCSLAIAPLVLAFVAGAALRDRELTAAALIVALAVVWLVPAQIWRSESAGGGWSQEPYLEWLYGVLCVLFWAELLLVPLGLAAGCAGWGLKLFWTATRAGRRLPFHRYLCRRDGSGSESGD